MKNFSKKVTSRGKRQENSSFPCSGSLLAFDDFGQNPKEATMVVGSMPNSKKKL
jgi:hypothetical protein